MTDLGTADPTAAPAAAGTPPAVLELRDLRHAYGNRVALKGVTFSVRAREIFGILGPNGSGKSTLFRVLATMVSPQGGDVHLLGRSLRTEAHRVRRSLGVVFQAPAVDGMLTVEENLRTHGHMYGLRGADLGRRIRTAAARLRVDDRLGDRVASLSGGLRRRVEIAKALLPEPRLLLMDEPTTGLDIRARRELWEHLETLREETGLTVVFTSHHMDEADRCDRLAILDRGDLVALDTPTGLRGLVRGDVVSISAEEPEWLAVALAEDFGQEARVVAGRVRLETTAGFALAAEIRDRYGSRVHSITVGHPGLEDVFIHLTGREFSAPTETA